MSGSVRHCCLVLLTMLLNACSSEPAPAPIAGGDPLNGRLLLRQFGCGSCHRIRGVADAQAEVGPPLEQLAMRVYLAGKLPNTPENLIAFIRDPQRFAPDTTMPDLSVGAQHARDMAAWLLSSQGK